MPDSPVRLSELIAFSNGKSRPTSTAGSGYRTYGANGVIGMSSQFNADARTTIVGRVGSYCGAVHYSQDRCWVTDNAIIAIAKDGVNSRYIYYLLKALNLNRHRIGSGQPLLTQGILNQLRVKKITSAEQDSIAALLGALDDKITVNDRIATTYESILRLRFEILQIDIDPDSDSDSILASDLIEFNPRLRAPSAADAVYLDMAALPTTTAHVSAWTRRPPKPGTRFMNGDTVIARITPCLENGKTAYVDFLREGEIGVGSTEFIVMRTRANYPTHLSYFLARSPRFRDHAIRHMVGSSGRQRVSASSLTDLPLRKPLDGELTKFGESASMAFAHIRSLGEESKRLAELRNTLLPKLMSGEIRVRDAAKAMGDDV